MLTPLVGRGRIDADAQIKRWAIDFVNDALRQGPCVGIFGPRQVGKSAVASLIASARGEGVVVLNLRRGNHRARFADAEQFFATHAGKLVVLDEAQEMPEAFDIVHGQLEEQFHAGALPTSFLILGSSSRALRALAADRLGARLQPIELSPIQAFELSSLQKGLELKLPAAGVGAVADQLPVQSIVQSSPKIEFDTLWLRGGFPLSLFAENEFLSYQWRARYVTAMCNRVNGADGDVLLATLRATLERLAANPGRQMAVNQQPPDFRACIAYLEQSGLVRRLPAWFANREKRIRTPPALFIRDTGILHAVRGCRSSQQLAAAEEFRGRSWESFCVEALASAADGYGEPFYYRDNQDELDLVLDFGDERWGIEIKHGKDPKPSARFFRACNDVGVHRSFFVHRGEASVQIADDVRALTLTDAISEVLRQR